MPAKHMRILLSCLQSKKTHALPAYDFWRPYFLQGCLEAGIECLEVPGVDWTEGLIHPQGKELEAWRARTWETVIAFVRKEHQGNPIQIFLGYLYPKQVEVAAINELQRRGIACVNFFCDNVREFRRIPTEYRSFALHWVPEFEALPMYRRAGLAHLHAPMPCWVSPKCRSVPEVETEPATFIGSADVLRRDLLGRALNLGTDLVVRGPGWTADSRTGSGLRSSLPTVLFNQIDLLRTHGICALYHKIDNRLRPLAVPYLDPSRVRPAVRNDEYVRITREALVTVGINRVPTSHASNHRPLIYSRLRDIEAPMLGACYLTEWTEGLQQLYEIGSEIETFQTPEELGAKIAELKKDNLRRRLMRQRAQRRALTDHSVARTLGRLREKLGLSARA